MAVDVVAVDVVVSLSRGSRDCVRASKFHGPRATPSKKKVTMAERKKKEAYTLCSDKQYICNTKGFFSVKLPILL